MPKFLVRLGAYRYESNPMVVEADTVEDAINKALVEDDGMYEGHDLGSSWVEEIEDENGVPLRVPKKHMEPLSYSYGAAERDIILASLRLMQREIQFGVVGEEIERIATNDGLHPALSLEEIDALCERINQ